MVVPGRLLRIGSRDILGLALALALLHGRLVDIARVVAGMIPYTTQRADSEGYTRRHMARLLRVHRPTAYD